MFNLVFKETSVTDLFGETGERMRSIRKKEKNADKARRVSVAANPNSCKRFWQRRISVQIEQSSASIHSCDEEVPRKTMQTTAVRKKKIATKIAEKRLNFIATS